MKLLEAIVAILILIFLFRYFFKNTIVGKLIWAVAQLLFQLLLFIFPPLSRLLGFGKNKGIHGTAAFAGRSEKKGILPLGSKEGLKLDHTGRRMPPKLCHQHLMLVSPSGQGKTSNFTYNNVLNPSTNASYLITDVSGEVYEDCSGYLEELGFVVQRLNLMDCQSSHQYNPIAECKTATDIDKLAHLLITSANEGKQGESSFWTDSAKMVHATLLKALMNYPDPECRNLHNLRYLVNQLSIDTANLNEFMSKYATQEVFDDYMGIISQEEKVLSDVLSTAKVSLKALSDPNLREVSAGSQIDFNMLREYPTVMFVSYNVEDISYLRFFLSIFWSQALNSFTQVDLRNKDFLNVYCILDEFQNLSRLPGFETSIAVLRKYNVSLFLMLQGLDGLNIYGDAAKILTGNCKTKLFTGSLQQSDNELISKMCGNSTVRYEQPNAHRLPHEERLKNVTEVQRPLMTPDEVRRLPSNRCLMFHGTNRPFILDLEPYYNDKELVRRTQLPPAGFDFSTGRSPVKYINLNKKETETA